MQTSSAGRPVSPAPAPPLWIYRREASATGANPGATADRVGDEQLIMDAVAHFTGRPASDVVVARHCRRCGGDDHGKPYVVTPRSDDGAPIQVSLSRAGGQVAVAVTSGSPIGFDIEDPAALSHASIDAAALHPAEQAALLAASESARDDIRTLLWCAKESVLKATGWGVAIDPTELEFALAADRQPAAGQPAADRSAADQPAADQSAANQPAAGHLTLETWPSALELDEAPFLGVIELPAAASGRMLVGVIAVIGQRPSGIDLWRI